MRQLSSLVLFAVLGPVVFSGCSDAGINEELEPEGTIASASVFGADGRTSITNINSIYRSVGSLNGGCTATVIGPRTILTAEHCLSPSSNTNTFYPAYGIQTANTVSSLGVGSTSVQRITRGRDPGEVKHYPDWAILEVADDLSAYMPTSGYPSLAVLADSSASTSHAVLNVGYSHPGPYAGCSTAYNGRPGLSSCTVRRVDNNVLRNDCDTWGGASGGPLFWSSGGTTSIVGVNSWHDATCGNAYTDSTGNTAAGAKWFIDAPWRAQGIAVSNSVHGNLQVFASDALTDSVTSKWRTGTSATSPWTQWRQKEAMTAPGSMAAVNLEDGRQHVWVLTTSGGVTIARAKYETTAGVAWSSWATHPLPTFVVTDIAAAGGTGANTALYALSSTGVVYETHKLGNATSSWSTWQSLGTVSGATSLAAVRFGSTYQVFVANSTGIHTTWANTPGSYGTISSLVSTSGVTALGAGVLSDGRVDLILGKDVGTQYMVRAASGSSWSSPSTVCYGNAQSMSGSLSQGSYEQIASGTLPDGKQQLFATRGGETFTCQEGAGGVFNRWERAHVDTTFEPYTGYTPVPLFLAGRSSRSEAFGRGRRLRDQVYEAARTLLDPGQRAALDASFGTAEDARKLAAGLRAVAGAVNARQKGAEDRKLLASLGLSEELAARLEAQASEVETTARQAEAPDAAGAHVSQNALDEQDGVVLHLVGLVYRGFHHASDPSVTEPDLGDLLGLFARRSARRPRAAAPTPAPAPGE